MHAAGCKSFNTTQRAWRRVGDCVGIMGRLAAEESLDGERVLQILFAAERTNTPGERLREIFFLPFFRGCEAAGCAGCFLHVSVQALFTVRARCKQGGWLLIFLFLSSVERDMVLFFGTARGQCGAALTVVDFFFFLLFLGLAIVSGNSNDFFVI